MSRRTLAMKVGIGTSIASMLVAGLVVQSFTDSQLEARAIASVLDRDAILFDESSAQVIGNDAYGTTFQDADGKIRQEVSLLPTQVFRDGTWVPASNAVTATGNALVAEEHPLAPEFPSIFNPGDSLKVSVDDYTIGFALEGEYDAVGAEVVNGDEAQDSSTITYGDVAPNTDLTYTIDAGMVKEAFVLSEAPTGELSYAWEVSAPGLSAELNDFGGVNFVSSSGEIVANIPIPVMWDSSGDEGLADSKSTNIEFALNEVSEGTYRFELKPDLSWLTADDVVFPVYVDPSVGYGPASWTSYKKTGTSGYTSSTTNMYIGNPGQSTWSAWRMVVFFNYSGLISGNRLTGVRLDSAIASGTQNCYPGSFSAATAWSWNGLGYYLAEFANCWPNGAAGSDAMNAEYAHQFATGSTNGTYMLTGNEGNVYSLKRFSSLTMTFYYAGRAAVTGVTGASPVATGSAASQTPQVTADNVVLQATGVEYTGYGQTFTYKIKNSSGTVVWTSPAVAAGPYRVPDTVLTPGQTYTYEVTTCDNFPLEQACGQGTNANWRFRVQDRPAVVANTVTVDSQSITTGAVTAVSTTPTLAATVSDPDGGIVWAMFTVKRDGVVVMDSVPGSRPTSPIAAGGTFESTVELPYEIAAGSTYTVEVQAFDGSLASPPYTPAGGFTAPPRTLREIPGTNDSDTGEAS